jgi:DNA invertase Pin-like site-specific DNA recombinase/transposase InsO family protein
VGTAAFDNSVRIGYARVSTRAQDHQAQLDALAAAHCREVIVETASTRDARPKLASALAMLQAGDTLVIYKPDRVARSMKELLVLLEDQLHGRDIGLHILTGICAGLHRPNGATIADKMLFMVAAMAAEMERDLIRERTLDGLRAAQAQGRRGGRPAAVDDDVLAIARARRERGESVTVIARHLSIGRSTLYRALAPGTGWQRAVRCRGPGQVRGAGPVTGPAGQAPLLTGLSSGQREQAMARFAVLRPHLEDGVPLARAAGEAGVAVRTAQRWLARYRACGLAGLARTARADTGRRRVPAELAGLIEGLALRKPRPTVAAIHRRALAAARQHGWPAPSYGTVYAIARALDPAMVTLAQDGQPAFRDRFELIWRHRASRPNALWQADHTELDVLVLDANGTAARPWLTTVIDDYSRAEAGYSVFLGAPSALHTSLALRQAIWRKSDPAWPVCGIPDMLT